ncbi:helix-turn-helix domain-containing protein [Mycolicibacterium elephantis]|uniref:HTH iclR-type domain-containing protein n=1 Tax=Mycolicibacterium elephantis DSM 44368 TaxID=1335622 RepID=A0A439DTB2_9MYCO|nr:helix-turn-helix domain-containing protein [Mycolicibacterium elephantis]MCV7223522.1 helix-turn-helix domain-containing protein [Mycolicibacterium elephantis]RWA19654.1 hypothetical protein MELE44368_20145 [Mycolicibacterium elephantis DSM 44368]
MGKPETSLVRSLQRGLQIMNMVAAEGPVNAKTVARAVGVQLPTAYHLLRTLIHDKYLVRLDDGTYVLGEMCRADLPAARAVSSRDVLAECS